MHINCPHCYHGIEVIDDATLSDVDCPSCGSHFSLLGEDLDETIPRVLGKQTIGRFQLVHEIGKGAFGSVWLGKDPQLDRNVAVKIPRKGQLNREESEQFFREARAAAQLKHPNIVPVHEIGKDGETIYIVSEFVQGVSLADRLTAGPIETQTCVELIIKICQALAHAHQKGIVHRDLKPGNVMLDDEGQPHVMDFGLAKREAGEITMTVDGQVLGTPAYMSPEQARGSAHAADGRSDLYSVGVILFQLLTGELPFRGNMRMLIHQVINEEAPSPLKLNANIHKDLATITSKCLEKLPDKRYATAQNLADDLQRYLNGEPIAARPIGRLERGLRWCRRKPALSAALAVSALLLLTLAIAGPLVAWRQSELKQLALAAKQKAESETKRANEAADEAEKSAKRSADVLQIVTDSFRSTNPSEGANAQMTARDVLQQAVAGLDSSELDDSGKAQLQYSLSSALNGVGEFEQAISVAQQMLATYEKNIGPEDPRTLEAMHQLAFFYHSAAKYDQALQLNEQTLAARKRILGADDPDTLQSMNNLALCYHEVDRDDESLRLREDTIVRMKKVLGENHIDYMIALNNLSQSLNDAGRLEEATEMCEQALKLNIANLGKDHPVTLVTMNGLGIIYDSAGRLEDSLKMKRESFELSKIKLGEFHPDTLGTMNNLAYGLFVGKRLEESKALNDKTYALEKKYLGEDHPQTLLTMENLAKCYESTGEWEKSLELRERAYELSLAKNGIDHRETLGYAQGLAAAYSNSGFQLEKSLAMFADVIDKRIKQQGPEHALTKLASKDLGFTLSKSSTRAKAYLAESKFNQAERLLKQMQRCGGEWDDLIRDVPKTLHLVYLAQREYPSALDSIDQWLTQLDPGNKKDRKLIAWAKSSQSECFLELGKLAEAEAVAKEALAIKEITDSNRQRVNSVLAVCLAHKKQFDEAEKQAVEAYEQLESTLGAAPLHLLWYLTRANERVITVYELGNRPAKGKLWQLNLKMLEQKIKQRVETEQGKTG